MKIAEYIFFVNRPKVCKIQTHLYHLWDTRYKDHTHQSSPSGLTPHVTQTTAEKMTVLAKRRIVHESVDHQGALNIGNARPQEAMIVDDVRDGDGRHV